MSDAHSVIEIVLAEIDRLNKILAKKKTAQVQNGEERQIVKATALAWFNQHRQCFASVQQMELATNVDKDYQVLLEGADRNSSRSKLRNTCKLLKQSLVTLRSEIVKNPASSKVLQASSDLPPSFASLVADDKMQRILDRRWNECVTCIQANAPLAATVMMGGLVEALLLARINREADKKIVFTAKTAPKDDDGKPLQLKEWTLKNYLEVLHEIRCIGSSAKDVGAVLRDYRNYIHPNKEYSHGIHLVIGDARLFWEITKAICRELLLV